MRAAELDPVLKCPCGCGALIPNDQVLDAAQIIHARLVQEQQRASVQKRKTKRDSKKQ